MRHGRILCLEEYMGEERIDEQLEGLKAVLIVANLGNLSGIQELLDEDDEHIFAKLIWLFEITDNQVFLRRQM